MSKTWVQNLPVRINHIFYRQPKSNVFNSKHPSVTIRLLQCIKRAIMCKTCIRNTTGHHRNLRKTLTLRLLFSSDTHSLSLSLVQSTSHVSLRSGPIFMYSLFSRTVGPVLSHSEFTDSGMNVQHTQLGFHVWAVTELNLTAAWCKLCWKTICSVIRQYGGSQKPLIIGHRCIYC